MTDQQRIGRRLFLNDKVQAQTVWPIIYFKILDKYEVTFNILTWKFSDCTCLYGSYYGINKSEEKHCRHIAACKEWIKAQTEQKASDYLPRDPWPNNHAQLGNLDPQMDSTTPEVTKHLVPRIQAETLGKSPNSPGMLAKNAQDIKF